MNKHEDKGMLDIKYNILNLPSYIKFNNYVTRNGEDVYRNMKFSYRADGVKIKKTHNYFSGRNQRDAVATTEYLDGFQYTSDTGDILHQSGLKFFPTSEGYYDFENNKYIYSYVDHLGNIRVSYTREGANAVIVKKNDYYAFGLKHGDPTDTSGLNYNYEYNGKEYQGEIGMYDYGARFYMPDLGRWGVVDPLAEISRRFSPYVYGNNNPMRFTDPDGRSAMDSFYNYHNFSNDYRPMFSVDSQGYMNTNPLYQQNNYIDAGGSSGGGGYTFTGNAAGSMYNYFVNGGSINGISFVNGEARWYTLDGQDSMYVDSNGMANVSSANMIMHRAKLTGNDFYLDYWGLLNNASTAQSYATNGIGATLGNVARTSNNLVDAGKMIKTPNIFKTYNLYRSNGYLNGNKYISGRKFLNNVKGINALNNSKVVKGIGYAGLVISVEQFRVSHHPGYISRGITSFGAGFIPYVGPAISIGIDNTNVNYWNIWTWGDPE
ncbi:RHS repeat-associated core domain-containing protein [uncultured Chryseobacterium sp.]|uniref:RHS repeat-associated core domain-containing protein n=1 Tax=uncultured Chryseobacterium sp. TaxID=259322 RepID=UPI002636FFFB|nr:RHS repeat-associated core domain-containing protein [uncultured Chryseobacterium sp.]